MGNKLYVGNLPYSFRDEDLQQTFSQYGSVGSAKVMMERDTGRSKGCLLYTSPSPRDVEESRMPSSA